MSLFQAALAVGALGSAVIAAVGAALGWSRPVSRLAALSLLWFWASGVVYFTFGTASGGGQAVNLALLDVTNRADVIDSVLNITMFLPGGMLLAMLRVRWFTAGFLGFLGSLAIEITQYLTSSGRTADVNDLLGNTLGFLLGFACAVGAHQIVTRRRRLITAGLPPR